MVVRQPADDGPSGSRRNILARRLVMSRVTHFVGEKVSALSWYVDPSFLGAPQAVLGLGSCDGQDDTNSLNLLFFNARPDQDGHLQEPLHLASMPFSGDCTRLAVCARMESV